jgi:hypothetical protein
VISGCVGPQDDGYNPVQRLTADDAHAYHATQIGTFADTAADTALPDPARREAATEALGELGRAVGLPRARMDVPDARQGRPKPGPGNQLPEVCASAPRA